MSTGRRKLQTAVGRACFQLRTRSVYMKNIGVLDATTLLSEIHITKKSEIAVSARNSLMLLLRGFKYPA